VVHIAALAGSPDWDYACVSKAISPTANAMQLRIYAEKSMDNASSNTVFVDGAGHYLGVTAVTHPFKQHGRPE
jgi:hypothetical protein